jgi:hypothetical protein
MLFFRIIGNGYDKNGNYKYKIVGYKSLNYSNGGQFDYMSTYELKRLNFGRINNNNIPSITTKQQKHQIIELLEQHYGKNGYMYVFE